MFNRIEVVETTTATIKGQNCPVGIGWNKEIKSVMGQQIKSCAAIMTVALIEGQECELQWWPTGYIWKGDGVKCSAPSDCPAVTAHEKFSKTVSDAAAEEKAADQAFWRNHNL